MVPAGSMLTLTGPAAGTIYYTTDGTDPRLVGGEINPTAQVYAGPISLNSNPTITVRLRLASNNWSDDVSAAYRVIRPGDYSGNGIVDGADLPRLAASPRHARGKCWRRRRWQLQLLD